MSVAEELRKHACLCRGVAAQMQYRFTATSLLEEADECERAAEQEEGRDTRRVSARAMNGGSGRPPQPEGSAS